MSSLQDIINRRLHKLAQKGAADDTSVSAEKSVPHPDMENEDAEATPVASPLKESATAEDWLPIERQKRTRSNDAVVRTYAPQ